VRGDAALYGEGSRIVCRQPAGIVCVDDVGYIYFIYQAFQRVQGPLSSRLSPRSIAATQFSRRCHLSCSRRRYTRYQLGPS
jgi:hypothetical protein